MEPQPQPAGASARRRKRSALAILLCAVAPVTLIARRRGYPFGGKVIVRCARGHLFSTIWVPLASFKAIRLGWWRFQRCPVGSHWTLVRPVKESDLTAEEVAAAKAAKDVRIP